MGMGTPALAGPAKGPTVTHLATFGHGLGSGSTLGPDGALYVTDGVVGAVYRIDRRTGQVSLFASGLPPKVLGIGGAMDLVFVGRTAYVLVTMVGGDILGGPHVGDATVGLYRVNRDGTSTVVADIGAWSVAHAPKTGYFLTTGVQYSIEVFRNNFVVTDGHHNRVLQVTADGAIREFLTFANVVPTGLETDGRRMFVSEAGPIPHSPQDGRVLSFDPFASAATEVARGARLLVDVELGPRHELYAVSQGQWDGVMEGSPALPNTGRLVRQSAGGMLTPVVDANGSELVLDRPTSIEFVGRTGYVVSLTGDVYKVSNL